MKRFFTSKTLFVVAMLLLNVFVLSAQEQEQNYVRPVVTPPQSEVFMNGSSMLVNGLAEVHYNEIYLKMLPEPDKLRIMITPDGSWSGIYVFNQNDKGFTVKSESGDLNAKFNWMVVGEKRKPVKGVGYTK